MSKLRVHEIAGEFGIAAEEVIALLRSMDVPVRSHMSLLTDDQVARARVRWEREKRHRAEAAEAPEAKPRRRRAAKAAEPEPAAAEPSTPQPTVRRRRRADVEAAAAEAEAAEAAAEAASAAPGAEPTAAAQGEPAGDAGAEAPRVVRRRAAAPADAAGAAESVGTAPVERAPVEAPAPAVAPAPAAPVETPAERAAEKAGQVVAKGDDTPDATPAAPPPRAAAAAEPPATPAAPAAPAAAAPAAPAAPRAPESGRDGGTAPTPAASATPSAPSAPSAPEAPPLDPNRPRPRPIVPQAPRQRTPYGARPVASAAPGGGLSGGRRTSDPRAGAGAGAGTGMAGGLGGPAGGRRGKKGRRGAVDQGAVSANISRTMTAMRGGGGSRRRGRYGADREELEQQRQEAIEREKKTVRVNEFITVSELAQILGISATQIVGFAFKTLGLMVTINQRLDFDQIELIASEFGFEAVREEEYTADLEDIVEGEDADEDLVARPPVVTIMGHVDHGKTSLLDYIRKATVVAGEAGGITQHIGAYHVTLPNDKTITFLDTPGHEAFTAMRARGAQVTDIVVLVVAADDQVMPQTVEAISHAKSAGVPMIVAINKIDLPQANPMKVKQDLLQHDVVLEDFGGSVLATEISAKKGTNVEELLEQILLQAEILDLKANPDKRATGAVVEAQLDPGKGPVATVLVQSGTLKVGDDFICGMHSGRVRALLDERGKQVKEAGPAIPVQILGLQGVPMAGDQLIVVDDASKARDIAQRRERLDREAKSRRTSRGGMVSLEDFMSQAQAGEQRQLRILIKADQGGPAEALADALGQLSTDEVKVDIVHRAVGAITESDILLAKASGAIIIGFHVRPDNNARSAAEREGVDIRLYRIIYEAVAEVKAALEGMLRPEEREVVTGEAEVRETFKVPRIGTVAGCYVRSGTITRGGRIRVVRDGIEVYDGAIGSLRRFKEDVREVKEGYECGIGVENFNDIKVGDVLECYRTEEVARTLEDAARS